MLVIRLTMGVYTHSQFDQVKTAIDNLPDFDPTGQDAQQATGTDNSTINDVQEKNFTKTLANTCTKERDSAIFNDIKVDNLNIEKPA